MEMRRVPTLSKRIDDLKFCPQQQLQMTVATIFWTHSTTTDEVGNVRFRAVMVAFVVKLPRMCGTSFGWYT